MFVSGHSQGGFLTFAAFLLTEVKFQKFIIICAAPFPFLEIELANKDNKIIFYIAKKDEKYDFEEITEALT